MRKLKNLLIIGGVAVIAVLGISIVRAVAAPTPWEQSWPANTEQAQTLPSKQSSKDLSPATSAPSNSPSSEPASSSPSVSTVSPSTPTQSITPVKPDASSVTPPTVTNQASSIQSVSPQPAVPTSGTVTPGNQSSSGYWYRPMNPDFRPPYSWYPGDSTSGWRGGQGDCW